MVYKWFLVVYKVSYGLGILGYVLMMATFLGLYIIFAVKPQVFMDAGILMMFYALYYGVMARDFAEICTEKMVSRIGVSQDIQVKPKCTGRKLSHLVNLPRPGFLLRSAVFKY